MLSDYLAISPKFINFIQDILLALSLIILSYFCLKIAKNIVFRQLKKIALITQTNLDDQILNVIEKHIIPITYFGFLYLTFREIQLNSTILAISKTVFVIATTYCSAQLLIDVARIIINFYSEKYHESSLLMERNINAIFPTIRVIIWTLAVIFTLSNLGFDIAAIIAGLGIGGVAIALASQGVLQDLFSYFAILFDRPCEIGDLISIDDFLGYVENIGIKTTRIKALTGEQLILANTDLTSSRMRNFKRMTSRLVKMKVGVIYETPNEQLAQISQIIEDAFESLENVTFDLAYFCGFGDFSLDFEILYYVHSNQLREYRLAQHRINLAIKIAFSEHNLQFAYPTQLNYLSAVK